MAKESFCLIMWKANHGAIDSEGLPTGPSVKSLCDAPEDCAICPFMETELNKRAAGTNYLWVCPDCADQALLRSKELAISTQLPGYYTSGYCQRPLCRRVNNSEIPAAEYSNFLQLLIVVGDVIP